VYMDGHPQATVVLFPCSLVTQGFMEATMGITVCLLLCLFSCSTDSVSNGSIFGTGRFYRSASQRSYHIKNRRFFKRTAQLSPPILIREYRAW